MNFGRHSLLSVLLVVSAVVVMLTALVHVHHSVFAAEGDNSIFAGIGIGNGFPAGTAIFRMNGPGLTFDTSDNNLLISDAYNNQVREVDSGTGDISAFFTGAQQINGIDYDGAGFLYVATWVPPRVHKVDINTAATTTVAGNGSYTPSGDGGLATSAGVTPRDVAVDSLGNVYIDQQSSGVRRVDVGTGIITTVFAGAAQGVAVDSNDDLYYTSGNQVFKYVHATTTTTVYAGTGVADFTGDGGLATAATFNNLWGLEFDSSDNLYLADANNRRVRRIDAVTGFVSTVAGDGNFGNTGNGGLATSAPLATPLDVTLDHNDDVYVMETGASQVRKIDIGTGVITGAAGHDNGDGGLATDASLYWPRGVGHDSAGNIYISEQGRGIIRKVDAGTGVISTIAGTGLKGFSGDGGLATAAQLASPQYLVFDSQDNLYVSDWETARVRRIDAVTGIITTVAGDGGTGYNGGDGGPATSASLYPYDIALDANEDLYISANNRVRKVDLSTGIISTVAGNGGTSSSGDGGLATDASFYAYGLDFDSFDNFYIEDGNNRNIRKVDTLTGLISTYYSHPSIYFFGMAFDAFDNLYLANWSSNRLDKYTPLGALSTIISGLTNPISVDVDPSGNVYVAELHGHRVRKHEPLLPPQVSLSSPNGGETLSPGSLESISWTAADASGVSAIDLEYTLDDLTYLPVPGGTGIANTPPFIWLVPGDASDLVKVRVRATDTLALSAEVESAAVLSISEPACVSPPADLVSWWKGDGNADDAEGVNHGTLQNAAVTAPGRVGEAFSLDGVNQYVDVSDAPELRGFGDFSYGGWFKSTSLATPNSILSKYNDNQNRNVFTLYHFTDGTVQCSLSDGAGAYNYQAVVSNTIIGTDQWHHALCVRSGSDLHLYLDGRLDNSTTVFTTVLEPSEDLQIGRDYWWDGFTYQDGNYFEGLLDEMTVFDRALLGPEIEAVYGAGTAGMCQVVATGSGRRRNLSEEPVATEAASGDDSEGRTTPIELETGGGSAGLHDAAEEQQSEFLTHEDQLTALDKIRALNVLFAWMNAQSYELLQGPEQLRNKYQIIFQLRDTIAYLGKVLGYADGFAYRDPDKLEIENIAELLKVFALKFNGCFSQSLTDRMLTHDVDGNLWWWAGYWHVLGALIQQPYQLWDPIDRFNMLRLIERLLTDFCAASENV